MTMRVTLFFLLLFIIAKPVCAQPSTKSPPKVIPKTSPASQVESQMNAAINELNKQIGEIEKQLADAIKNKDEAEIKELKEQLAMLKKQASMMSGLSKNVSMMPDKVIQQATEEKKPGTVPQKDVARIKQLPDKILSDDELVRFVKKVDSEVEKLLPAKDKAEAQKIYSTLKSEKRPSAYISNVANSLWMSGYPELALYILGKECNAGAGNANNLNNYAAFLSMTGAEHAAIPILQNLEKKFPDNSTILNNIGQSWFGLGDMNNAKKYFASTLRAYGLHSQANQTMCLIQESEGNKAAAIESIKKSIRENYTSEKEARLNELGGKLEYKDLPFRYPAKAEPLGIEKFLFTIPAYPFEGGVIAQQSQYEWDDFRRNVSNALEKINKEETEKEENLKTYQELLLRNSRLLKPYNTTVYKTSARKLALLNEWYTDRLLALSKKRYAAGDSVTKWKDELYRAYEALGDNQDCSTRKNLATGFMSKANTLWQQINAELLSLEKQKLNAEATYALYGTHDRSIYEMIILKIKQSLLTFLGSMDCEFEVGCIPTEAQRPHGKVLPDFDSVNCNYIEEYDIKPFTKIRIECNRMITEFDIDTELGFKVKAGWEENLNSGKITKGTLEIGYEVGPETPTRFDVVGAELKGQLSAGVEIDGSGVKEFYIKGSSTIDLAGAIDGEFQTPLGPSDPKGLSGLSGEVKLSWNVGKDGGWQTMQSSTSGKLFNYIDINIGSK